MPVSKKPSNEDLAFIKTQVELVWVDGQPRFARLIGKQGARFAVGSLVGTVVKPGYRLLSFTKTSGERVNPREHNLVWYFVHGEWPGQELDHKDLNRLNNHPDNFRPATRSQNCANRSKRVNNTTGFKGVSYRPDCVRNPFYMQMAYIDNGTLKTLASNHPTAEEAAAAYRAAMLKIHGEFARQ